jgi:hypothetical protein
MATSCNAKLSFDVDAILNAPDRAALEAIVLKFAVEAFPSDPTGLAESTSALIAFEAVCDAYRARGYPSNSGYQVASDRLMDFQREWFKRDIKAAQAKGRDRLAMTAELVMETHGDSA